MGIFSKSEAYTQAASARKREPSLIQPGYDFIPPPTAPPPPIYRPVDYMHGFYPPTAAEEGTNSGVPNEPSDVAAHAHAQEYASRMSAMPKPPAFQTPTMMDFHSSRALFAFNEVEEANARLRIEIERKKEEEDRLAKEWEAERESQASKYEQGLLRREDIFEAERRAREAFEQQCEKQHNEYIAKIVREFEAEKKKRIAEADAEYERYQETLAAKKIAYVDIEARLAQNEQERKQRIEADIEAWEQKLAADQKELNMQRYAHEMHFRFSQPHPSHQIHRHQSPGRQPSPGRPRPGMMPPWYGSNTSDK